MRTKPRRRKARRITDVTNTDLGKEEMAVAIAFGANSLKEGAMWHLDPLLGNDPETNN
jgi:hypothetical protein